MKLYKIIILLVIIPSIYIAQFSEVLIDIDYSNISEKEMFIFENFESEIQAYFMNNYFFDDPDELEITLDIHIVIENVNAGNIEIYRPKDLKIRGKTKNLKQAAEEIGFPGKPKKHILLLNFANIIGFPGLIATLLK